MFFLLKIGHYNNINRQCRIVVVFSLFCLKATLYHNGIFLTFDIFMLNKYKYLLKTSISLTKHLNKQNCLFFYVLHISYLIKSDISYPAVALRQRWKEYKNIVLK